MKMEAGYRLLKVGDKRIDGDEYYDPSDNGWFAPMSIGHMVVDRITNKSAPHRRHITAELDNDLTWLANELTRKVPSATAYTKLSGMVMYSTDAPTEGFYTIAQINEEKARWNLPLIEVEKKSASPEDMIEPEKFLAENLHPDDWPSGLEADIDSNGNIVFTDVIGNGYTKEQVYGNSSEKPNSSEWVPEVGQLANVLAGRWHEGVIDYLSDDWCVFTTHNGQLAYPRDEVSFEKPETPEQKAERELLDRMEEDLDWIEKAHILTVYDWLKENKKL